MKKLTTICATTLILITSIVDVRGVMDTRLLLNFEGTDAANSTVDSSPQNHRPIKFFGNAQIDIGEKYDGVSSLLLDGAGDYLTIPDSADWDICGSSEDNWTIDFWVRMDSFVGTDYFITQGESYSNRWGILHTATEGIRFLMMSNGNLAINAAATVKGEITDSDWHHIALCKVGSLYANYKDGTQVNYANDTSIDTFAAPL
jgi:hypothetical protein